MQLNKQIIRLSPSYLMAMLSTENCLWSKYSGSEACTALLTKILQQSRTASSTAAASLIAVCCFSTMVADAQTTYTPYTFSTLVSVRDNPNNVAVDAAGNVYTSLNSNETILRIAPNGGVTTLAGTAGVCGSADGVSTSAQFCAPAGVAVDGSGNVYVADHGNSTIRKITPSGVVTTLAGTVGVFGLVDGTGNAAQFNAPNDVAVDASANIYVADSCAIRIVTPDGVVATLVGRAGCGSTDGPVDVAQFGDLTGIAVDTRGNIYVADPNNDTIRRLSGGSVTTIAGSSGLCDGVDATGGAALFCDPTGVAVDTDGNVFVTDKDNFTIRKITPAGVVTTLAGIPGVSGNADGTGSGALFKFPRAIALDQRGKVYVADFANKEIRVGVATSSLSSPTNLRASQVRNSNGTQIRLAWDYGTDPIDGFIIEREVPSGNFEELANRPLPSVCVSGHCAVDDSGLTVGGSAITPFGTYSYRVRAFQAQTESDPSSTATCFQLQLITTNNNHAIFAFFTPNTFTPDPNSLGQVAQDFNFDHFDWISLVTHVPSSIASSLKDHFGNSVAAPPPPLLDPLLGGWNYRAADFLPYYWDEQSGFDPRYFIDQHRNATTTEFQDQPWISVLKAVLPSDNYQFVTFLVGVEAPVGSASNVPPRFRHLASFSWSSNSTCITSAASTCIAGGIGDIRLSNLDPSITPGPGAIFNITLVKTEDLPLDVRQTLIQLGGEGISIAPKIDTDAPTTAAFLSGPQGSNGWYTGPVTAMLIATDIDGPTDIASTTLDIDGGPTSVYSGPFGISGDGIHTIQFGSTDQAGNVETPRPSQTIKLDATPPSITCTGNPSILWPPNGKMVSVTVSGTITDSTSGVNGGSASFAVTDSDGQFQPSGSIALGSSGNYSLPFSLVASRLGSDRDGRQYTIVVSASDNAGNVGSCSTVVTVPHDQRH